MDIVFVIFKIMLILRYKFELSIPELKFKLKHVNSAIIF
jgi:hypothetical protein